MALITRMNSRVAVALVVMVAGLPAAQAEKTVEQRIAEKTQAITQSVEQQVSQARAQAAELQKECDSANKQTRTVQIDKDQVANVTQVQSGNCSSQSITIGKEQ